MAARTTAAKKPTAVERTVSMFTGKMDVEDPNARDGYAPSEPRRMRGKAPRPRIEWAGVYGTMNAWESTTTGHRIELDGAGNFNLTNGGKRIGSFKTCAAAATEAEKS